MTRKLGVDKEVEGTQVGWGLTRRLGVVKEVAEGDKKVGVDMEEEVGELTRKFGVYKEVRG